MDFHVEAPNLYSRYRQGDAFRRHVRKRVSLVLPAVAVFVVISIATTTGSVVYFGGTNGLIVLLGLILAPFFMLGSLSVQLFVFFSWLERRALERITGRRRPRTRRELLASIPWVLGAVFLVLPFVGFALLQPKLAALLLLAGILTPVAY